MTMSEENGGPPYNFKLQAQDRARGVPKVSANIGNIWDLCRERICTLLKLLTALREQDTKMHQCCWVEVDVTELLLMSLGC